MIQSIAAILGGETTGICCEGGQTRSQRCFLALKPLQIYAVTVYDDSLFMYVCLGMLPNKDQELSSRVATYFASQEAHVESKALNCFLSHEPAQMHAGKQSMCFLDVTQAPKLSDTSIQMYSGHFRLSF